MAYRQRLIDNTLEERNTLPFRLRGTEAANVLNVPHLSLKRYVEDGLLTPISTFRSFQVFYTDQVLRLREIIKKQRQKALDALTVLCEQE